MLKIITPLAMLLMSIPAQAQIIQKRAVSSFDKIKLEGNIELIFTQGIAFSVMAEAADSLSLNNIATDVEDNTLFIHPTGNSDKPLKVHLTANQIKYISIEDQSRFCATNTIECPNLTLSLSSKAIFSANVETSEFKLSAISHSFFNGSVAAESVSVYLRDGSKARLAGKAKKTILATSTNSFCNAQCLVSVKEKVEAFENSTIIANAEDSIEINFAEGSHVFYAGIPKKVLLQDTEMTNTLTVNDFK
jgi:hypothetical protein